MEQGLERLKQMENWKTEKKKAILKGLQAEA